LLHNHVFWVKNTGATYQRAIQQCLHDEIRDDLVEAYVDNVVVKTRVTNTLIDNLIELSKPSIDTNGSSTPKNTSLVFLPVLCSATSSTATAYARIPLKSMQYLVCSLQKNVKDVQKLTGCMTALSRFISQLGEKGLPFFKLLKASNKFVWTEEADTAFAQLKVFLTSPPVLTALLAFHSVITKDRLKVLLMQN